MWLLIKKEVCPEQHARDRSQGFDPEPEDDAVVFHTLAKLENPRCQLV